MLQPLDCPKLYTCLSSQATTGANLNNCHAILGMNEPYAVWSSQHQEWRLALTSQIYAQCNPRLSFQVSFLLGIIQAPITVLVGILAGRRYHPQIKLI